MFKICVFFVFLYFIYYVHAIKGSSKEKSKPDGFDTKRSETVLGVSDDSVFLGYAKQLCESAKGSTVEN